MIRLGLFCLNQNNMLQIDSLYSVCLLVFFFQSRLSFFHGFTVFGQVCVHELVLDFAVTADNALLDLLVAVYDALFNLFVTTGTAGGFLDTIKNAPSKEGAFFAYSP